LTHWTVLGGRGFVGSRLVDHLRAQGAEVWVPDRVDEALWNRALGHVMYCIGLTGDFRQRPFETMEAHVGVLSRVLQRGSFDTLTYLSSTRVYMGSTCTDEEAPLKVHPSDSSDLYNLSKLAGEALCHAIRHPGVRVVRLSNVVGPGMDPGSGNFVAALIAEARRGHVQLRTHPDSEKDYIDIRDVTALLPMIALHGRNRVYNVASGVQMRHREWVEAVCARLCAGWSATEGAPLYSFAPLNTRRIAEEFGFTPRPLGVGSVLPDASGWT
jgi:nucleoside-diphosphate-sugar epimerase